MNSAHDDIHSQKSFSRCGYSVSLFAFVESLWNHFVRHDPVSMISRYPE